MILNCQLRFENYCPKGRLPYKRLMGMCRWMGSHFQNWMDFNGVAFSIELLEWGCTFCDFCCEEVLHIYRQQTYQNARPVGETQSVLHSIYKICQLFILGWPTILDKINGKPRPPPLPPKSRMGKWRVFALGAASSLIWRGGWRFAVPFYFVQDCT